MLNNKCQFSECPYEREEGHRHCCHRCMRTLGTHHSRHCARILAAPGPEFQNSNNMRAERERSPIPTHSWRIAPDLHSCIVVSLGFNATGGSLLWRNRRLRDYVIDVTHLHDDKRGGPWGTNPITQQRVKESPGFHLVLETILGQILNRPLVIIACNAGHHRSVATAEIAAARIRELASPTIELEVVHVDANECTWEQWRRLEFF